MTELLPALMDVVQLAHDTMTPHEERKSSGGADTLVILAGVVVSLGAVAGLVWLKKHAEAEDA